MLHPAVGRQDESLRRHEEERIPDPPNDGVDVLHRAVVGEVDDAYDQRLAGKTLQNRQIDLLLSRLYRDLMGGDVCQLFEERVSSRPRLDDAGVPETGMQGGGRG